MQIHNLVKTSLIDYPNKIACVVFTQGCMWRCWYCQNAELLPQKEGQTTEQEVFDFLKMRKGMLDGVVICGGEPTMQPDFKQFIKKVKNLGFCVKLDTNGTNPDVLQDLLLEELLDYVAMDIKAPIQKYTEVTNTQVDANNIKKSIDILLNSNIDYEFRTTAIPTLKAEDFLQIAQTICGAHAYYVQHFVKPKNYNCTQQLFDDATLIQIVDNCNKFVPTKLR